NHGPMAAEALVALGCDDVAVAWAARYRRQLDAMPPLRSPVTPGDWAQALGAIERFGDWVAFFRAQLAEAPWRAVFGAWIGRLLPATPSAGAHGLIRTAHALRALAVKAQDVVHPGRPGETGVCQNIRRSQEAPRMNIHQNARLTPQGRAQVVQ